MIERLKDWLFRRRYRRWASHVRIPIELKIRGMTGTTDYMRGIAGMSPSAMERRQRMQRQLLGQMQFFNPSRQGLQSERDRGLIGDSLGLLLGPHDCWQWEVK